MSTDPQVAGINIGIEWIQNHIDYHHVNCTATTLRRLRHARVEMIRKASEDPIVAAFAVYQIGGENEKLTLRFCMAMLDRHQGRLVE